MTIDEIKQKICDQYCQFPNMQYTDVQMNDICSHCPLNDLPHWIPCSEKIAEVMKDEKPINDKETRARVDKDIHIAEEKPEGGL